jgi:hypothetical protein
MASPTDGLTPKNHSKLLLKKDYSSQCPPTLLTSVLNPKIGFMGHNLVAEIFDYITNNNFLAQEFPFLQISQHRDLLINFAAVHVILLTNRINEEIAINPSSPNPPLTDLIKAIEFFT